MSGPKRTNYELERQRREELERQRQIKLENQRKINQRILDSHKSKLNNYTKIRQDSKARVNEWIRNAETDNLRNDFRSVQNQIKGILNFLNKLDGIESNIISRENERERIAGERERRESEQKEIIIDRLEELQSVKEDLDKIKMFSQVSEWIKNAEIALKDNKVSEARNGISGINSFLEKHSSEIEGKLKVFNTNQKMKDKLNLILEEKEILTEGIKQRISIFSSKITDNQAIPPETITQIKQFLTQVDEIREKYEQSRNEQEFVKEKIVSGFDGGKGSESGGVVSGSIGNTPVKITFDQGNKIVFNIDESKGGCQTVLTTLQKKLEESGISLGDIYIERTGQTMRINKKQSGQARINA